MGSSMLLMTCSNSKILENHRFSSILATFDDMHAIPMHHLRPWPLEARAGVPGTSASRFRTRTHALDSVESFLNRFGDFHFSTKIKIFEKS